MKETKKLWHDLDQNSYGLLLWFVQLWQPSITWTKIATGCCYRLCSFGRRAWLELKKLWVVVMVCAGLVTEHHLDQKATGCWYRLCRIGRRAWLEPNKSMGCCYGSDRQTNGQTDRQTDRPTDRQTDRQTKTKPNGQWDIPSFL